MKNISRILAILLCLALLFTSGCKPANKTSINSNSSSSSQNNSNSSSQPADNSGAISEQDNGEGDSQYPDDGQLDYNNTDGNNPDDGGGYVIDTDEEYMVNTVRDVNDYNLINSGSSRLKLTVKSDLATNTNKIRVVFSEEGKGSTTLSNNDYLEYDVMMSGNTIGTGIVDLEAANGTAVLTKAAFPYDMDGTKIADGYNLGAVAANKWYHRKIKIPSDLVGKTIFRWSLYQQGMISGAETTTYFDNIQLTDGKGSVRLTAYSNGTLKKNTVAESTGIADYKLKVTKINTDQEIIPQGDYIRMIVTNDTLAGNTSSYIAYKISSAGKGTYQLKKGDILVYKVRNVNQTVKGSGCVDIHLTDNTWLSDADGLKDTSGFSLYPSSDLSGVSGGMWYYRSIVIPDSYVGKTVDYFTLKTLNDYSQMKFEVNVADVKIINSLTTKMLVYGGGQIQKGGLVAARNATMSITKSFSGTNIGSPSGNYLKYAAFFQTVTKASSYTKISSSTYEIQKGDYLEYDINYNDIMPNSGFGVDLTIDDGSNVRFSGWRDQNGLSGSTGIDLLPFTANKWYHRKITLGGSIGKTISAWSLGVELASSENVGINGKHIEAGFDNIRISNGDKTMKSIYGDGAPSENVVTKKSNIDMSVVSSTPLNAPKPLYTVPSMTLPSSDYPVMMYNVKDFGAKANGIDDDTNAIQSAIFSAKAKGGGLVFAPAGKYVVKGILYIPTAIQLRGEWQNPLSGGSGKGTIFLAYDGKGDTDNFSFITMQKCSALTNISVFYPEQNANNPEQYPWTIQGLGDSIQISNVTLYNSYLSIKCGPRSNGMQMFENIFATALTKGIEIDCNFDTPRFFNLTFTPDIWANSTFGGSPSGSSLTNLQNYLIANLEVIRSGKVDFLDMYGITVDYAKIGIRYDVAHNIEPSTITSGGAFSNVANVKITNVNTGIQIDKLALTGLSIACGTISATKGADAAAIRTSVNFEEFAGFNDLDLSSSESIVKLSGNGEVSFQNCKFNSWNGASYAIENQSGMVMVSGSQFAQTGNAIHLASGTTAASINSNTFNGTPVITDNSGKAGKVGINHTAVAYEPIANNAIHTFRDKPNPGTKNVYLAENYGIVGDGITDCTAALQSAIDAAAAGGGGIVYLPAGKYKVLGVINLKSNVELHGAFDSSHHSSGAATVLQVYASRGNENGTSFITLQANAGVNGIDFFYPEQLVWNIASYPYTVQSRGEGTYLINSTFINSYKGADFGTYNSDKHYISGIGGCCISVGLFVGNSPTYGTVQNSHIILHYWSGFKAYGAVEEPANLFQSTLYLLQADHLANYIFGDCKNESVLAIFGFTASINAKFINQGNGGFKGKIIVPGFDAAFTSLDIQKAENISIVAPFIWGHGQSAYTVRSYVRSYATNTGKLTIFNATGGAASFPIEGFYVENGDITIQQFSFAASSQTNNAYIKGGNVKLYNIVTNPCHPAYGGGNPVDLRITSGASSVKVVGWLSVNRPTFQLNNGAGNKYSGIGIINATRVISIAP